MIAYDHTDPAARFLYEKAGRAAYAAYRRLEWEPDQDFEDAKQEAALTFWETFAGRGNEEYSFVAARNAVLELLTAHKNPLRVVSLDYQESDDDEPWESKLLVPQPKQDELPTWLHEVDLRALVRELYTGKRPGQRTLDTDAAVLTLLVQGYDTAGIAVALGKTESSVKMARKKLKAKLVAYCERQGIEPPEYNRNGGGWRPAHHYGNFHGNSPAN
jgi:hypothetical protein